MNLKSPRMHLKQRENENVLIEAFNFTVTFCEKQKSDDVWDEMWLRFNAVRVYGEQVSMTFDTSERKLINLIISTQLVGKIIDKESRNKSLNFELQQEKTSNFVSWLYKQMLWK